LTVGGNNVVSMSERGDQALLQIWNATGDEASNALAAELGIAQVSRRGDNPDSLYLFYENDCLVLGRSPSTREKPVAVDFVAQQRDHHRGKELLLKAIGGRRAGLTVVDATAGLGRDSYLLAGYGAHVTLCERNPVVAALLADGLARGRTAPEVADVVANMRLQPLAAQAYLESLAGAPLPPDVVYLDPMFPESGKSALVKKEMRLFHSLVGKDEDAAEVLAAALDVAKHRVVVKRPPHAAPLRGKAPQFAISGKAVRYDVYPLKAFAK
jgi:16S rRNA (guanine1516-N2)-methyltransferase